MSLTIGSTSSLKASKNPGLALDLKRKTLSSVSPSCSASLHVPSANSSLSNTPELEPDWPIEQDTADYGDDDEAQYIYIAADSPFYRAPSTPHTSSYLSVSGFPFACDALSEEDPLFTELDEDLNGGLESEWRESDTVVIVDDIDFTEGPNPHLQTQCKFTEALDPVKSTRAEISTEAVEHTFQGSKIISQFRSARSYHNLS